MSLSKVGGVVMTVIGVVTLNDRTELTVASPSKVMVVCSEVDGVGIGTGVVVDLDHATAVAIAEVVPPGPIGELFGRPTGERAVMCFGPETKFREVLLATGLSVPDNHCWGFLDFSGHVIVRTARKI